MLGINWTATNQDQFLISLYTGILSGITTGIFVGIVVWFIISQIDKRRLHRQYEREIAEFREKLRFVLDKIDATFLTNIADPPTLAGLLASELKEHPLSIWEENTKKEKELWLSVQ